jgi:hypothetical protein
MDQGKPQAKLPAYFDDTQIYIYVSRSSRDVKTNFGDAYFQSDQSGLNSAVGGRRSGGYKDAVGNLVNT